jgi:hypothetical protein
MVGRQYTINSLLRPLEGKIAVELNHRQPSRYGLGRIDLDLVVILGSTGLNE